MDCFVNKICALAHPENTHFILKDTFKLSCNHFACKECIVGRSADLLTVCCSVCFKISALNEIKESVNSMINDNLDEFHQKINEKFNQIYLKLNEKKNEFEGRIGYLREEIDVRVESLKQELDKQADLLKHKLDEMLKEADDIYLKHNQEYNQIVQSSKEISSINVELLDKMQQIISNIRETIKNYEIDSKLNISEDEIKDDLILKQDIDFEKIIGKAKTSIIFDVNGFCVLRNGQLCVLNDETIKIYESKTINNTTSVHIPPLLNNRIRKSCAKGIVEDSENNLYIHLEDYDEENYIVKLNQEFKFIGLLSIHNFHVTKTHYYNNYVYLHGWVMGKDQILRINCDLTNMIYNDITCSYATDASFLNNRVCLFKKDMVWFYELEPFELKVCHNIPFECTRLVTLNNRYYIFGTDNQVHALIFNEKFEKVHVLKGEKCLKNDFENFDSCLMNIVDFGGRYIYFLDNSDFSDDYGTKILLLIEH